MPDNVMFRKGTQAGFNNLTTINNGTFYLTTDSHRLYVGGANNEAFLLNQTVKIIANVNALEALTNVNENDFYYIQDGNILAVYGRRDASSALEWIQINKQAPTQTAGVIKSADVTLATENDLVSAGFTLIDNGDNPINSTNKIKFVGDDNIEVSIDETDTKKIVIKGQRLQKDVNNDVVRLKLGNDIIPLTAGDTNISITSGNGNSIIFTAENTTTQTVTPAVDNNSTLSVTVTDTKSNPVTGSVSVGIPLEDGSVALIRQKVNTDTVGEIYSKAQIDNKLKALNSMSFKGSISTGADLFNSNSNYSIGDVYIVASSSFTLTNNQKLNIVNSEIASGFRVGDLFIANIADGATENANGYIPQASLKWTYVPSGNDDLADVYYDTVIETTAGNNPSIELQDGHDNTRAKTTFIPGTDINLGTTGSAENELKLTINHATYSAPTIGEPTSQVAKGSFTAITGLNVQNGHITGVNRTTFTPETYTLNTANSVTSGTIGNSGTIAVELKDSGSNTVGTANVKLTTSTLSFSNDTTNSAVKVDMVWGSF